MPPWICSQIAVYETIFTVSNCELLEMLLANALRPKNVIGSEEARTENLRDDILVQDPKDKH